MGAVLAIALIDNPISGSLVAVAIGSFPLIVMAFVICLSVLIGTAFIYLIAGKDITKPSAQKGTIDSMYASGICGIIFFIIMMFDLALIIIFTRVSRIGGSNPVTWLLKIVLAPTIFIYKYTRYLVWFFTAAFGVISIILFIIYYARDFKGDERVKSASSLYDLSSNMLLTTFAFIGISVGMEVVYKIFKFMSTGSFRESHKNYKRKANHGYDESYGGGGGGYSGGYGGPSGYNGGYNQN